MIRIALAAIMALFLAAPASARPAHAFPRVGSCSIARITLIGARLEGDRFASPRKGERDPGTTVGFGRDRWMISYDFSRTVYRWRKGDRVRLCVVSLPKDCPAGDDRGVEYRATNLRTRTSWTAINSEHFCGGA